MVVDLPNEKYYVNGKALYSAVGCVAPNGYSNDVYLTVYSGAKYQYEPIIKSFPGGISIGEGSAHPAYISDAVNGIDCSFVYDLDENNSLIATISDDLKNMLTLEEIAKELYKLITPVN